MKYLFVVVTDNTAIWFAEDFKTAYQLMYQQVTESSDNTYMDMYALPSLNMKWAIDWWLFWIMYWQQVIWQDDYETLWIEFHCILEWTCTDDIRAVNTIANCCDLVFKN